MRPDLADLAPAHVREFVVYTPSLPDPVIMRQFGLTRLVRLNNNENPLGPPPAAREAIEAFGPEQASRYPSGDCLLLREALSQVFGPHPDRFLVGTGSCELIACLVKTFCQPGDNIVTADKTFAVYEWVAQFSGFEVRTPPMRDHGFDPQAMLEAADDRTKIFFVCNPNNPTGSCWDHATLEAFLEAVDGRAMVVADEAYREFVERPDFPDTLALMERHPNLVLFRTFSKMYGLAGLRVGWLCASPQAVDLIRRTLVAYSVNSLAQAAARAAILHGQKHVLATRDMVRTSRDILLRGLAARSIQVLAGEGNYLMMRTGLPDTLLSRRLLRRGFMVRTMTGFRFPNWVRVSLDRPEVMEEFMDVLDAALDER